MVGDKQQNIASDYEEPIKSTYNLKFSWSQLSGNKFEGAKEFITMCPLGVTFQAVGPAILTSSFRIRKNAPRFVAEKSSLKSRLIAFSIELIS